MFVCSHFVTETQKCG